ncbi:hypothetical protein KY284_007894 [Solanum tuberosum]|nr:hypothetical protein KY284_007894 [Solanum tuberosum]
MDISWVFIAFGAWLLALAFLLKNFNHPKRKLPPGPRPWPIIGNLNLLGSLPRVSLHHLSQNYGDLVLLKFGSKPVLVATSPEMAKEILKTHDTIFASRPVLAAGKYTSYNYSNIIWAPYGAHWRQARKFYLTKIFSSRTVDSFEYIRVEERRTLISHLFSLSGKPVLLKDHLPRFTVRTIVEHKAKEEDYVPEDMVDTFLHLADDPNLQVKLTSDRLMGLIHDLVSGATDTSAATIEWEFQELLRKPNIIDKAQQELDRVIGKERWVEEDDFSDLPYIDVIIKETFRLHPLAALLPPHYSIEDCNVVGYDIPKGTTVFVNAWSLGRSEKCWDRPEEFISERFVENNIDIKGQNFALLPFGSGRRRCPGYSLAMKIVRTTMANLLHGFKWKLAGNMKLEDISMEEIYGLTTHPN